MNCIQIKDFSGYWVNFNRSLQFPTFIQNSKTKHKHHFWLLLIFVVWDSWPSWFDFGTSFPPDALPDALPTSSGLGTSTENTLSCATPVSEVGSLALNWTWVTSVRALKLNHSSSSDLTIHLSYYLILSSHFAFLTLPECSKAEFGITLFTGCSLLARDTMSFVS